MATANVCTLAPAQHDAALIRASGLMQHGRVAILEGLFDRAGFDIVGVQEARIQLAQRRQGRNYVMVSSSADANGAHGVQLWVHNRLEGLIGATVPASPRLLAVRLATSPRPTWAFVIHAPSASAPPAETDGFWAALDSLHQDAANADPEAVFIGLADFNARLGSTTSAAVGGVGAAKECPNGLKLRMWLEANGLRAANTFEGGQPTWTGSRGHRSRIDYVYVKQAHAHAVSQVSVEPDIDLSTSGRADHDVLSARVDLGMLGPGARPSAPAPCARRRPKFCPCAMEDPARRAAFQRDIGAFKRSGRAEDVDEHLAELTGAIQSAAARHFPPQKHKPRKHWIKADTWEQVRMTAPLRRQRFEVWRRTALSAKLLVLTSWRCAVSVGDHRDGDAAARWRELWGDQGRAQRFSLEDTQTKIRTHR